MESETSPTETERRNRIKGSRLLNSHTSPQLRHHFLASSSQSHHPPPSSSSSPPSITFVFHLHRLVVVHSSGHRPELSKKKRIKSAEDVGLGPGGDRGGAVCAAVAGAAGAAAGEAPPRGVRQHAHQRHGNPRPRHHLLRPHRALRHRHRSTHHHRLGQTG